jgi:hypothetical protein
MWRSGKFWILFILVLLSSWGLWFFLSSHKVAKHASFIPADAAGVITFNTKRLAADFLFGSIGNVDSISGQSYGSPFKKIMATRDSTGIRLTTDVFLFTGYSHMSKEPYYGLVFKTEDIQMMNTFFTKVFPHLIDTTETHVSEVADCKSFKSMVLIPDHSSAPIGIAYNKEVLILLLSRMPNVDMGWIDKEMRYLFSLSSDRSILSNTRFVASEKRAADVSFWFDSNHPLLNPEWFTPKDKTPAYCQGWLDFSKGQAVLELVSDGSRPGKTPLFNSEESSTNILGYADKKGFVGLLSANLNVKTLIDKIGNISSFSLSMLDSTSAKAFAQGAISPKEANVPLSELITYFNGKTECIWTGFTSYPKKYIDYEFDENFNHIEVERKVNKCMPSFVLRMGLNGPRAITEVLPKMIQNKQLIPWNTGYKFNSAFPLFLFPAGNGVILTNSEQLPVAQNPAAPLTKPFDALFQNQAAVVILNISTLEKEYQRSDGKKPISSGLNYITLTVDESKAGGLRGLITLTFKDSHSNAFPQLVSSLRSFWSRNQRDTLLRQD